MSRLRGILNCRRCHLRKTFLYLIVVTIILFLLLSWCNYLGDKEEELREPSRSVENEFSYYYQINVDELRKQLPSFKSVRTPAEKDPFTEHYFNKILSDDLPSDRQIPDTRDEECPQIKYRIGKEERSSVSVIITFHNEALSALLRTIVSVLHRTPPDLLREVILVDDFSETDFKIILEKLPRIKYLKNDLRLGLIQSRNRAAKEATGRYLFFLDSHTEVNSGWLEPLLDRVVINKFILVSPVVDIIDPNNFQYKAGSLKLKAGFDWSLRFKWIPRSEVEMEQFKDPTRPFLSPMTYGGIFLIHKDWFNELNQFDDELEIWGGESVEMSIKNWLCGGQIEIVPCSRVGHIFRKKHPYSFPSGSASQTVLKNTKRVAETWLEEYKKFYYLERPQAVDETINLNITASDTLKDRLQCRPFSWYLQVVFPELKIPNKQNLAYGELVQGEQKCLQISIGGHLEMIDCFSDDHVTTWALQNGTNVLTATSGGCLTAYPDSPRVGFEFCKTGLTAWNAQRWLRSRGNLINMQTRMCLESFGRTIGMSGCRNRANSQMWHFSVEIEQRN